MATFLKLQMLSKELGFFIYYCCFMLNWKYLKCAVYVVTFEQHISKAEAAWAHVAFKLIALRALTYAYPIRDREELPSYSLY